MSELAAPLFCRGVRGAITVDENTTDAILTATRELLNAVVEANGIAAEDIGSVYFTTTVDLNAEFPAIAARQLGWYEVPLICAHEMAVPHGLPKVVRVLIMWNTTRSQHDIQHVYLRDAQQLRPDLSLTLNGRDKS